MHECQEIRSANINQKEGRFLIYERDLIKEDLEITFNMTLAGEIVLDPNELPLNGEEKHQLIKVMQEIYADRLIINNDKNSAYIKENLSFW